MDSFEKAYFKKLRKIALDFNEKRELLAQSRIKMFVAATARQILDEKQNFDLIIGAGNSGLFMTKITKLAYESLKIKPPKIINIPILRFKENKELFDNSSLLSQVKNELRTLGSLDNVLFVDDEIMQAITARTCFGLILKAKSKIMHVNATIIAENHFFEWHYFMPKVSVRFFSYARLIQWLNGNIGYFIPKPFFEKISATIPDVQTYNHAMAIVIGRGLKRINNDMLFFDYDIEQKLKKAIHDYKKQKGALVEKLQKLVVEAVNDYKTGQIKFRF